MAQEKPKGWDYVIILIVFAITGSTSAYIMRFVMPLIPIEKPSFLYGLTYFVVITIIYQFLILAVAFIFGKFQYFYTKQQKIFKWIGVKLGLVRYKEES